MKASNQVFSAAWVLASLFTGGAAAAADAPKLAAPIYKGAVPAVSAAGIKNSPRKPGSFGGVAALDCSGMSSYRGFDGNATEEAKAVAAADAAPWCFLTRDPIEKVKAFYDKAVGSMYPITGNLKGGAVQGYAVAAERAWYPGDGERSQGHVFTGVSLHALPVPPAKPKAAAKNSDDSWAGQEAFQFYAGTRHFSGFVDAVDWFGDPSKRKPAELDSLYRQHSQLESALFQRKGPKSEAVDETLRARYNKQREQAMAKAAGAPPSQAQIQQMQLAAKTAKPASQDGSATDARFEAFMQRNPKVAKQYTELSNKVARLMQQGKYDEADAADEELEKLVQSHPELAALEREEDEGAANRGAAGQAQQDQASAAQTKQMDQAIWGTSMEYLKALEKEGAYYTLIVIDRGFRGDEKDYSRDRAVIDKETKGRLGPTQQQVMGFQYGYEQAGGSPSSAPAQSPSKPSGEPQDELKDAAKEGWKALKKLF